MSQRHYIEVINKKDNSRVLSLQILGNNDWFDEEFYENIGVIIDESSCFDIEIKDYAKFILEWHNYLEKHPEKRGLPKMSKSSIEECNHDAELWKDIVYLHYRCADSYELQMYVVTLNLAPFVKWDGTVKEDYKLILECF